MKGLWLGLVGLGEGGLAYFVTTVRGQERHSGKIGSYRCISTSVRCSLRSAEVNVTVLLTLLAVGISFFPVAASDGFVPRC